ncbi:tRNA (adenine-N(1)-)-methyltransferase [Talaromyces stipitatus ATCC 10500]|uniref:tRNA (adenine(58)-N(1))-methyltransferase catalytic subunit TRM61 n=1 Tax=Talaromyces stipitatus (strain ATCC 10500 / CBS 375.48 / QM 6759 / NRRL 1006) TaxID=441959 RepID=B8LXK8_TALSN|nr:tRNA (adenine-N(1)-)-methyltransferase [Talaromyces stipitatus ATCC 10500]EED24509.1 tRNA (adenine-N(1)-)-methyltransferase [Talaromyces stipitatus ATCC 10500]
MQYFVREKRKEHRLSLPTLEEYVVYTPRLVTPIYGADASLIVSLLDIHAVPPAAANKDRLEILEAGTGHGSLTLHLARAIQAANTNPPPIPQKSQVRILEERPIRPFEEGGEQQHSKEEITDAQDDVAVQKDWDEWRSQRSAVIHTVDVSPKFSRHAEQIVRGFRRGIYAGNVDFHVGAVEDWIKDQLQRRSSPAGLFKRDNATQPFLSYAILDMPAAHKRIPHVAPALRRDGLLVVFMPSITQIGECVQLIRKEKLPFVMEKVVELGTGISGGRLWDVRMAVKKSRADPSSWTKEGRDGTEAPQTGTEETDSAEPSNTSGEDSTQDNVLVCRPKVGSKIVGGGFVGIWRRIEDRRDRD